jgi:hypothetical protein
MKNLRLLLPSVALAALTLTGCFLTSGQFLITLDLDPVTVNNAATIAGLQVDLADNSTYNDHKEKIKDIADFAVLGDVTNNSSSSLDLEVYMVEGLVSTTLTLTQIQAQGTRIWGPLSVPANGGTISIGWDESAALFGEEGKAALLAEVQGDGQFTLFAVGGSSPNFTFTNGKIVVVLAAGIG